jgi:hypothetical protein
MTHLKPEKSSVSLVTLAKNLILKRPGKKSNTLSRLNRKQEQATRKIRSGSFIFEKIPVLFSFPTNYI